MSFENGSTVGDYQILGTLGAGGMGKVYKVRNVISDRIEAMKVLLPDLAGAADLADRFVREIKVQASLEHPNIASLHTALRVENQLVMLMEFVEGETLEERLKRGGPLPVPDAVRYISQVLAALSYAHQRGVIHRDIKPANMMLTGAGSVKLMDFGIAKAAADRRLTMTGTTMGSLYYMSPEQIKGEQTLDARSDLYSVGVSLYELGTGKRPLDVDSQCEIMSAHLQTNPVPPITVDPSLPQALNDVILVAVGKEAGKRFQTADAFRNALLSVGGAVAPAAPVPPPERAASGGHRGLWIAAGALATVLVAIGLIQFGPWRKTAAAPPTQTAPAETAAPAPAPAPTAIPAAAPVEQTPPPPAPKVEQREKAAPAAPVVRRPVAAAPVPQQTPPQQTTSQQPSPPQP
ncbi:MAG: serine/threonine protein kinase, partial [Acidobacteria bacterium]